MENFGKDLRAHVGRGASLRDFIPKFELKLQLKREGGESIKSIYTSEKSWSPILIAKFLRSLI